MGRRQNRGKDIPTQEHRQKESISSQATWLVLLYQFELTESSSFKDTPKQTSVQDC
uniref:Uncharacterized protein n=1 Tax=Rhizophora mucronata TaxID=61149 RepID=A0A2P2PNU5_RHIMU